jgi:hypothetical protein
VTRRTHFAYRIDLWSDDEKEVVEYLADVDDLTIALATYHAACKRWPGKAITLRQGPPVIKDNRRSRLATLFSFPWSDKPFPRQRQAQPLNRQSCDRDYPAKNPLTQKNIRISSTLVMVFPL